MAEPAQVASGLEASPIGAPDIKQEAVISIENNSANPIASPSLASKRPLEQNDSGEPEGKPEAKKVKTEDGTEEDNFEDGLALLVQNALSNVNGFGDAFDGLAGLDAHPDIAASTTEANGASNDAAAVEEAPPVMVTFMADPEVYMKRSNLHALGSLALSLLLILAEKPIDDTIHALRNPESQHARSFRRLRTLFETTRELYSSDYTLFGEDMGFTDTESRSIFDLANMAQLGALFVDGGKVALLQADNHMAPTFQIPSLDVPPKIFELYLLLKTQRAVQALLAKTPEQPADELLTEVMVSGLEDKLRARRKGLEINSTDRTFVASVQARKAALQAASSMANDILTLKNKYPADDVLRNFCGFVRTWLSSFSDIATKLGLSVPPSEEPVVESHPMPEEFDHDAMDLDDLSSLFEKTASGLVQNALAGLSEDDIANAGGAEGGQFAGGDDNGADRAQPGRVVDLMTDYKELEALVAESTSNYVKTTLHGLSPVPYQPTVPTSTAENMAAQSAFLNHYQQHGQHPYYAHPQQPQDAQPQQHLPGANLPPNQTLSSAMLYDKARQAALSKSSAHTRREGLHSTRRPWTQEEEKALMAGLDMVKGPHWSQILTLFGPNGTISDILKDRTQVQLKDKARNLKLFFLKTNSEMPYYLQAVTGELKTRAPTQAARKEAEERARMNSEEDQAKLQGILALAGGLQQHPTQARSSASPAKSVAPAVVTPAQAASAAQAATGGQGYHAAGQSTPSSSSTPIASAAARPPVSAAGQPQGAPQFRPNPSAAQQLLQSIAQTPRPQGQLAAQIARAQAQMAQRQQSQQHASIPNGQHQAHGIPATATAAAVTPASASATQQTIPATPQAQPAQQAPQPAAAAAAAAQPVGQIPQTVPQQSQQQPQKQQPPQQPQQPPQQPQSQQIQPSSANATPQPTQTTTTSGTLSTDGQAAKTTTTQAPPQTAIPDAKDQQHADDAAETALLQGLQAAMAEATS